MCTNIQMMGSKDKPSPESELPGRIQAVLTKKQHVMMIKKITGTKGIKKCADMKHRRLKNA